MYINKYILIFFGLLVAVFLFHFTAPTPKTKSEKITGSFTMSKPDTVFLIDTVETIKKVKVFKTLPEQKKVEIYSEAIQKREYKKTFSDDLQKINITAKTTGFLDSLSVDYEVQQFNSLYLGAEAVNSLGNTTIQIKAYYVKPRVIYSAGYDVKNKAITAGVAFKLFRWKH
ncbi:hypothetical protein Phi46:1_gp10 [Cellulophaga phage phi46:1]|uniref:hypothetical protein n=1 Tax=Cellulophaga phage phi46:1 TaxID=1327974 RepID=UPI000351BF68|nr:hypothetical protein Phi46:1_gp10 [Cellulophaga phage phi46:1]AGO47821.1 hypothetical protein Phi46:1_gp10 [Cellulophaga phage phi46:1]